jgi:hypothetical protein
MVHNETLNRQIMDALDIQAEMSQAMNRYEQGLEP